MTQPLAIIVAAAISVVGGFFLGQRSESRSAHRDALGPYLSDLGEAIHEVTALSTIVVKRVKRDQAVYEYIREAERAANDLKDLRRQVMYTLWGVDDGLRTLSRLPDWINHAKQDPPLAGELVNEASKLAEKLDETIRESYLKGRPPRWYERGKVSRQESTVRRTWEKTRRSLRGDNDALTEEQ